MTNFVYDNDVWTIKTPPPRSDWQCDVFGDRSLVYVPLKDREPNWFHRKMQELCFGVKWRKVK